MSKSRRWGRRNSAALLASAVAVAAVTLSSGSPASADPATGSETLKGATGTDKLGAHDEQLVAKAEAKKEQTVMVIVATEKGKAPSVAAELTKLGGKISKQVDAVGYVRATVPTGSVRKAAKLPGIAAVDVNETIQLPQPEPGLNAKTGSVSALAAVPAPGADTPAVNPYMPTSEIGAVAFKKAHPTWDGRGVTIGIMDSGVDLDHPALQKTTTGERKIVDWVTATDPVLEGDGTWRPMITSVTGPSFVAGGVTYKAPAGAYRFNNFAESITAGGEPAGDVNRDGDTTDRFGVLYNATTHDIRVDSNQNLDFTDDAVMRPYKEKFDVGHFGTDNPATPVRDQMPFVVEYRLGVDASPVGGPTSVDYVNIGIIEGAHGTHVAGITAANDMFGNANLDGAAPGAKIVSARACSWTGGCTAAALTDGMVDLVTNRKVDVINMSIGGLPALNDANNARAQLYDRLINDYGVQMFISAGNEGPGLNTIGDPSVATDVVSVAAGISKETWLANYGSVVRKKYDLFNFSSRGPREDGGFKPNITAPGSAISTTPLWQVGGPVPQAGYPLPPGYSMFNGTSMSSPQATGGAALVLSAAKANDKGITPAALRRALYTAANRIDGVPAYGQGNGQLDVPGTWDYLKGGLVETRRYTSDAPVCTPISEFLETPNRGVGLYNRCASTDGGLKPNQAKKFTVKITRTTGASKAIKHDLRWVNNDGTFSAAKSVDLPLNKAVNVAIDVKGAAGAHGAILEVDDPKTAVVDFELLNTVVVANDSKAPAFSSFNEGAVDRNLYKSYFVTVPKGAATLQINLSGIATGSQVGFTAINPYGLPVEDIVCFMNNTNPEPCDPQERDYQNPMPGIWEITVQARRASPALENPYNITARIQGVAVTPATVTLPSVTKGTPTPVKWAVKNNFGPVKVTGKGGPLGSAASGRKTIANGESQTTTVDVPAGATKLDVAIGNTSDLAADLDLVVLFNGAVVGTSADGDSDESVSIAKPAPGTYTVRVDGYAVPAGTTQFDYRDVFYSASLGSVSVPSTLVTLANGATAAINGTVTAQAAAATGRELFGEMTVVTNEGAIIGRGNVTIGAVN